jgi:hypothetical protein
LTPWCLPDDWDPATNPKQQWAWEAASKRLRRMSAGLYGQCRVKVETCPPSPVSRCRGLLCGCSRECRLRLEGPAYGPVQVWVDGQLLPDPQGDLWRIEDEKWLVRQDGGCFPGCARVEISYLSGWPVCEGDDASLAVTALALHLLPLCTIADDGTCELPPNLVSMTRGNSSYQFKVPGAQDTGVPIVDSWLSGINPCQVANPRVRIYTPDLPQLRVTTWPCACPPEPEPVPVA